jgi:hypothetical protein
MARGDRFKLQPILTPQHWCRHGWNALRHKRSGVIVTFHGNDPTAARNRCLRELNRMPPKPKLKIEHIDSL